MAKRRKLNRKQRRLKLGLAINYAYIEHLLKVQEMFDEFGHRLDFSGPDKVQR